MQFFLVLSSHLLTTGITHNHSGDSAAFYFSLGKWNYHQLVPHCNFQLLSQPKVMCRKTTVHKLFFTLQLTNPMVSFNLCQASANLKLLSRHWNILSENFMRSCHAIRCSDLCWCEKFNIRSISINYFYISFYRLHVLTHRDLRNAKW